MASSKVEITGINTNNLPKLSQFRKCCTNVRETLHNWYPEFEISNKKYS